MCDGNAIWPQLEFAALTAVSGVHSSGTVIVRVRQAIASESVFPCIGQFGVLNGHSARFCPAALSPAESTVLVDGSPFLQPLQVGIAPPSGGVVGTMTTVPVGSRGWAFFAYCREPPPSLTLSTAAICTSMSTSDPMLLPLREVCMMDLPDIIPVITVKRELVPGDELLVVFNQFDGIGKLWTYPTPSPFVRVPAAVPLLLLPHSMDTVRKVLASQSSTAITDSYVKLLEETAGMDARTTERIHVALANLQKAVQHYIDTDGSEVLPLPLVMPVPAVVVHAMPAPAAKKQRVAAKPSAPMLAASFRIPQSFNPHHV